MILYKDCPIRQILDEPRIPKTEESCQVVIFPNQSIECEVLVPKHFQNPAVAPFIAPHIPSTLARTGLHAFVDTKELEMLLRLQNILKELWVTVVNWGTVPVIFTMSRRHITLSNLRTVSDDPVEVIHLHANDEYLAVRREALTKIRTRDGRVIPCVNPDDLRHFESCFQTLPLSPCEITPGDFLVIGTRERIEPIPENHIGIISSAKPNELVHSSATLIYPGSGGYIALEFLAKQNFPFGPDVHVANLAIYKSPNQLAEYNGKYKNQESIKPHYLI